MRAVTGDFMRDIPVLVTGGTGFLGRRLVERLLAQGRFVTMIARRYPRDLERRGVRFLPISLDNRIGIIDACSGVETVFHVAAKVGVHGSYDEFFETNVQGTRFVIDGCREKNVKRLIYTSTPSVVYNGGDLSGVDESAPLATSCPSAYPMTKLVAEREVLIANSRTLQTVALRPHLIWGNDDPHLVPRVLERAATGRLRIIGSGRNRVDMVHVDNAVDAHLLAERALVQANSPAAARAYFITNGEPVYLWDWINHLLKALDMPPVTRRMSLANASRIGAVCELLWRLLPMKGEPPMTRFVASELARDHWFDITAARRDLGYVPRISMAEGTAALIAELKARRDESNGTFNPSGHYAGGLPRIR